MQLHWVLRAISMARQYLLWESIERNQYCKPSTDFRRLDKRSPIQGRNKPPLLLTPPQRKLLVGEFPLGIFATRATRLLFDVAPDDLFVLYTERRD